MSFFPQDLAFEFYYLKGFLALIATVLLIVHMTRTWHGVDSLGRRLRYLSLLYFAVLITSASVEQANAGETVGWRSIAAIIGAVLLIVTIVVSLREERPTRRTTK